MFFDSKKSFTYGLYLAATFFFIIEGRLAAREIGPEANLCAEINRMQPGEALMLRPGDYRGPCRIRHGGSAGSPIVIEAQNLTDRPRIVYEGQASNVFEINADYVTLRGLKLGPTKRNIDGVRIRSHAGVIIEDCEFSQLGGIAIAATHTSVHGLVARRNIVTDSAATAMYFGCHDGVGCQISDLLVERNFIHRVDAPEPEIGYGIQVKLNSTGVIRDNVIADTKGPAIMVYGSLEPTQSSVIERNFVTGSRTSSGILIGGGPALVQNNISSFNFEAGIGLQDYANRGLLRKIVVTHNTSFKNGRGEFLITPSAKLAEVSLTENAAAASESQRAFPIMQSGLVLRQNADCSRVECFTDPLAANFSPLPSSPLATAGNAADAAGPRDDYFGRRRNGAVVAGALESSAPAIKLGIKSEYQER
jgi:hypothetical protein